MPTYESDSRRLLAQAREDLYLGDTRQASAKGWQAAAQLVQSVAAQRGWEHHDHAALYRVIRDLTYETGNAALRRLFAVAVSLEANYYEHSGFLTVIPAQAGIPIPSIRYIPPIAESAIRRCAPRLPTLRLYHTIPCA